MFSAQEIFVLRKENARLKTSHTKLKISFVSQKQKADRLEGELKTAKDEIKKLKDELEKMRKQRDTYKGMIFKPKVVQTTKSKTGKKLGGQTGHTGVGRRVPERINQTVRVFLKTCPDCKLPLKRSDTFETHTVEDIPNFKEVKTITSQYKMERQWCQSCRKEVVGKPTLVIPHSRLGLNLIIQMLIFKYVCRMSLEILVETLYQTYGVKVTQGGIVDILKRVRKWLGKKEYGELLQAVRGSPIKHADETGWRINGINGWLWAFLTKTEVYYTIEETRGGGVARSVLEGSSKDDVLIRDDYAAYKKLPLNQQSCWAHLLRKSKEEATQKHPSKQMKALHFNLKNIYQQLAEIICQPFNQKIRYSTYQYYSTQIQDICITKFRAKDARRIQTRIKHQGNNLLTALLYQDVPLTNNAAERQIRPAVVVRKISGGSRSNLGAETFAVNFSIIQSIRMRNQPLIPTLQNLLLKNATGKY